MAGSAGSITYTEENHSTFNRIKRAARLLQEAIEKKDKRFFRRPRHAFRYYAYLFAPISGLTNLTSGDPSTRYMTLTIVDKAQRFSLGTRSPIMREYLRNEYCLDKHLRSTVIKSTIAIRAAKRSMAPNILTTILHDAELSRQKTANRDDDDYREATRIVVVRYQQSGPAKRLPTLKEAMKELRNVRQKLLCR